MRPFLVVLFVVVMTLTSTLLVLHLRNQEPGASSTPAFTVGLTGFNLVLYSLLATLIP